MKALSLLFLGLIVGVAYGQQHEVDARTPTTLLDEAGAAHQEQLRVEHQASMETLQQEGVTIITQDVTMNVDTPTRITFDYAAAAGQEVTVAPLSDVADLCIEAIRDDLFWATYPLEHQTEKLRARFASMLDRTPPEYLREVNLRSASAEERSKQ